jgi:hypothetical protein
MTFDPAKFALPTYPDLEPKARAWAVARGLIRPNGQPKLATVLGQYGKTLEEIQEVDLAFLKLRKSQVLQERCLDLGWHSCVSQLQTTIKARRHALALEFGDVLMTLSLLAAMHTATLEACLVQAPYCPGPVQTWQFVDEHAAALGEMLEGDGRYQVAVAIGAVARCVEDEASIVLELSGPECLVLALAKIEGRSGQVVDGVFVKSAVTA